jgi:antitoxin ParD1/3/4
MSTRNIHLTDELDQFIENRLQAGRYSNASEVVRAGLRALEQDEAEDLAKVEALRMAVEVGMASGIAPEGAMDRLRQRIDKRAAPIGPRTA